MDLTVRPITVEEVDRFRLTIERTFGHDVDLTDEDRRRRFLETFELERTIAALDGPTIVGTAGAFSLTVTVPGGELPMGGTTIVTVRPTHRRRGILREMMRAHLDEVRDRGEPLAGLWASEAPIYGRFGFGAATDRHELEIATTGIQFVGDAPAGSVRMIEPDEAPGIAPAVFERIRPTRPGMLARSEVMWRNRRFHDPEEWREGSSARRWVVYEEDGRVDGYVSFRQKEVWDAMQPNGKVDVIEVMAATDAAYAGLWRFLFSVDLFPNVSFWNAPVDDPLPWMVDNRRKITRKTYEALWLRIMDVPAALTGRAYQSSGRVVLAVRDEFCPWNSGSYRLEVGPDGAACEVTEGSADLELDITDLGSIFLGSHRPSALAAAGRIAGDAAAVRTADDIFGWPVAAWCSEVF